MPNMSAHSFVASIIAIVLSLAIMTTTAFGQASTRRGYGGPLSVGPNFKTGNQWTTSDFGAKAKQNKQRAKARRIRAQKARAAKRRAAEKRKALAKARAAATTQTNAGTAATADTESDLDATKTAQAPGSADTKNIETGSTTQPEPKKMCTRFVATAGKAVLVECD